MVREGNIMIIREKKGLKENEDIFRRGTDKAVRSIGDRLDKPNEGHIYRDTETDRMINRR